MATERAGEVPREATMRPGVWGSASAHAPVVMCARSV